MSGSIEITTTPTTTGTWPRPLSLGLRLLFAYAVLLWLAHRYGRDFVEFVMPLFWALITSLDDQGRVLSLALKHEGADTVLRMDARLLEAITVQGKRIDPAGFTFFNTLGTGLILQPAIIACGLVLAWPVRKWFELPLRMLAATFMLGLLLIADTPLSLWAGYLHTIAPEPFSLLWWWEEFLVNGGRLALGLMIAVIAIRAAYLLVNQGHNQLHSATSTM